MTTALITSPIIDILYESGLVAKIETVLKDINFNIDKTVGETLLHWDVSHKDQVYGCEIKLGYTSNYYIELMPYIEGKYKNKEYLSTKSYISDKAELQKWFKQNLIYFLYLVKNFKQVVDNIPGMARSAGFEGMCLPTRTYTADPKTNIDLYIQSFELRDTYNSVEKAINVEVAISKKQIKIVTWFDHSKHIVVSTDKDAEKALAKFRNQIQKYMGQFDPHPRHYMSLMQNSTVYGENVIIFPGNRAGSK